MIMKTNGVVYSSQTEDMVCSYILERSINILNQFKNSLESVQGCFNENYFKAISTIMDCKGKVITTGMGKAGIAMRKFSATLCSLGIPSCYLHPGEASHGDLGILGENDILFVASTSGKTREIIEVITLSKQINNNPIIGLTSHPDSIIRSNADIIIDMGIFEEAGELKMAPTTSILIMQAITDIIALVISESKDFSKAEFGKYHHSGYLGDLARKH